MPRYWCPTAPISAAQRLTHGIGCGGGTFITTRRAFTAGTDPTPLATLSWPQVMTSPAGGAFRYSLAEIAAQIQTTVPTYVQVKPNADGHSLDFIHPVIWVPPAAVNLWASKTLKLMRTDTGTQLCPFFGPVGAFSGGVFASVDAIITAADAAAAGSLRYLADPDPCLIRAFYPGAAPADISVSPVPLTSTVALVEQGTGLRIAAPPSSDITTWPPVWRASTGVRYANVKTLGDAYGVALPAGYTYLGVGADRTSLAVSHSSFIAVPADLPVWATVASLVTLLDDGAPLCPAVFPLEIADARGPQYASMAALGAQLLVRLGGSINGYEVAVQDACQLKVHRWVKTPAVLPVNLNTYRKRWRQATWKVASSGLYIDNLPADHWEGYFQMVEDAPWFASDKYGAGTMLNGSGWPNPGAPWPIAAFRWITLGDGVTVPPAAVEKVRLIMHSTYIFRFMLMNQYPRIAPNGPAASGSAMIPETCNGVPADDLGPAGYVWTGAHGVTVATYNVAGFGNTWTEFALLMCCAPADGNGAPWFRMAELTPGQPIPGLELFY